MAPDPEQPTVSRGRGRAAEHPEDRPEDITAPPMRVQTLAVVRWGLALWALALVAVLVVPSLRSDGRGWWVWGPVAGLVLVGLGYAYLARGRGNAEDA